MDNQDFPAARGIAASQTAESLPPGAFGGTLRQSQIRLQAFGPDIAGARTSADVNLDFAGGFPDAAERRLRWGSFDCAPGSMRLDWANTSIVAGQDRLFFAPLAPTSLATLAIPALSYSGNLWAWTPQVRVEHRIVLSDASSFSFQGGILDNLTGDIPPDALRPLSHLGRGIGPAGLCRAGLPGAIACLARISRLGAGGYYGRQDWGFGRDVDGWAGTADLTLPLGKRFEFTGAFYRGRAVAGLGGGIGQSVLINGSFINPGHDVSRAGFDGRLGAIEIQGEIQF